MNAINYVIGLITAVALAATFTFYQLNKTHTAILWGLACWIFAGIGLAVILWPRTAQPSAAQQDPSKRPWVMIKSVAFHIEEGQPFVVTLEFRNTGTIPAVNIDQKWRVGVQTKPLVLSEMPPLKLLADSTLGLLPPGLIAFGNSNPNNPIVTKQMLADLKTDKAGAYAYGVLEYRMAGQENAPVPFETGFCFKATPSDLNGPSLMYSKEGNYAK